MARWMLSLGMFSARAARMAARRRGFMFGSGRPILAATVTSRASLENTFERTASTRPLRCMMFLNWECPAIAGLRECGRGGSWRKSARQATDGVDEVAYKAARAGRKAPEETDRVRRRPVPSDPEPARE